MSAVLKSVQRNGRKLMFNIRIPFSSHRPNPSHNFHHNIIRPTSTRSFQLDATHEFLRPTAYRNWTRDSFVMEMNPTWYICYIKWARVYNKFRYQNNNKLYRLMFCDAMYLVDMYWCWKRTWWTQNRHYISTASHHRIQLQPT